MKEKLAELNCISEEVPPNLTAYLQPMDLGVNKPIKDFLKSKFVTWFADKVGATEERGSTLDTHHLVELLSSISVLRDVHAGWLCEMVTHFSLAAQQQIIRNSFKEAGILQAISSAPGEFADWDC